MNKYPITWDAPEDRVFETGVSKGVLYKPNEAGQYVGGVPWNGLINVTDANSGADSTKLWADNIEYASMRAAEQYGCNIEAYTFPEEFGECDGSAQPVPGVYMGQQNRKPFGFCWRTELGNASNGIEFGYKLHLAYGLTASPTEKSHDTINDSPDAATMSWDSEATPVPVTGYKPTAKIEIDSTKVSKEKLEALEKVLYGSEGAEARMPLPDELFELLKPDSAPLPTVKAETGESTAYGKTVSELQDGVTISETKISGTLHYVKGYTGFAATDNDGNFLALKLEYPEDATVKCEVINGTAGEKTIPKGDHQLVCKIADKDTQKIKLTTEKKGCTPSTVTYDLTGLTLEEDGG